MNDTKKKTFGGYGISLACDGTVKDKAREIFAKLTSDVEGWGVYPNGCEGRVKIGDGWIDATIATTADYNDASQGFEIWLEARITKRVQKIFRAEDIDKAIAWIAKKTELLEV